MINNKGKWRRFEIREMMLSINKKKLLQKIREETLKKKLSKATKINIFL